ncbi:hypothetical protein SPRG_00277 [Saprolegnia parasitica CBS 223.65]|uniref:BEACH domain-containing protein n=1 Tax=Saprolegnia parasitica (strain CBS 223.65) TaxID=695850 RepID=A0A067CXI5_SAPPC|nr:hypothetical protein SPRG_00277 [Saprolegnia parasitica CBS 223.65]KDO35429.1 hypothetical protein SPRG_00277 [Saprolegnia parasitica CBS 223.65]|eukprot:XP_012193769.1 hypothetical protein SPRG_00277 [Saprolegnia parasitica CBS 223.65]
MRWDDRRARIAAELGITCCFPAAGQTYLNEDDVGIVGICVATPDGADHRVLVLDKATVVLPPLDASEPRSTTADCNLERSLEKVLCIARDDGAIQVAPSRTCHSLQAYLGLFYCNVAMAPATHAWAEQLSAFSPRQRNLIPLLGAFESPTSVYLVLPYAATSLRAHVLTLRQASLEEARDAHQRFLLYQLVRGFQTFHALPSIDPEWIDVTDSTQLLFFPLHPSRTVEDMDARSLLERWRVGDVSNLEYLLALNHAAGRSMARYMHIHRRVHPVLPWVLDFNGHHRDLTKSKFRLMKGDAQLDQTYAHTGHHIPENLSDLTVAIYLARRLPRPLLQSIVRARFEAKEYPLTMARLYAWSPEECIPEFFLDASIFTSTHDNMPSLDLHGMTPEAFLQCHRAALESPHVSRQLHTWIDLNFGAGLAGDLAIAHKNVPLRGFVQLFSEPHPPRQLPATTDATTNREPNPVSLSQFTHDAYVLATMTKSTSLRKASDSLSASSIGRRGQPSASIGALPSSPSMSLRSQRDSTSFSWIKQLEALDDDDTVVHEETSDVSDDVRLWALQPPILMRDEAILGACDTSTWTRYEARLRPSYPSNAAAPVRLACLAAEVCLSHALFTPPSYEAYRTLPLRQLPPVMQALVLSLLDPACPHGNFVQNILEGEMHGTDAVYRMARRPRALFAPSFSAIYDALQAPPTSEHMAARIELAMRVPTPFFSLLEPLLAPLLGDAITAADVFPTLVAKLGKETSCVRYEARVVRLYEGCVDDCARILLLSTAPDGLLWLLWHSWGSSFLLTHMVPVLLEWWLHGSLHVRLVAGFALAQLASSHMLGTTLAEQNVLPKMLHALCRPKVGSCKQDADVFWHRRHPPHTTSMGVLRIACELGDFVVSTVLLPTLYDLLGAHLGAIQREPTKAHVELQYEVVVVSRLLRALLDLVRDLTASVHAVVALLERVSHQLPPLLAWTGLVELVLALSEKVGPTLTKQSLQPSLQACVLSMHCPSTHLAPFPALESWYLGVGAWPPVEPLPSLLYEDVHLTLDLLLPRKLQDAVQTTWQRSISVPKPKRHSRKWTQKPSSAFWEAPYVLNAHNASIKVLTVLDDDRWLVSASAGGSCKLWRLSDMHSLGQWSVHAAPVTGVVPMPTLLHHFVVSDRLNVFLYQAPTLQCKWQMTFPSPIVCPPIVMHASIVVVQEPLTLHILRPTSGNAPIVWSAPRVLGALSAVAATTDDTSPILVLGGTSGHLCVLDACTGAVLRTWSAHDGRVLKLQHGPPHRLWSIGADRIAHLWDATSWTTTATVANWPDTTLDHTVVTADADRLVVASGIRMATLAMTDVVRRRSRLELETLFEKQRDGKLRTPKWSVQAMAHLTLRPCLIVGNDAGAINLVRTTL